MTDTIHSCGPTCTSPACITARVPLLSGAQCMEFRRMNCSFDDMVRAIYSAGIQVGTQDHIEQHLGMVDHSELVRRLRRPQDVSGFYTMTVKEAHELFYKLMCEAADALEGKHGTD